ncbi:MAG: S8 family serine peptidase, partial [Verrucomicrobia bacterium]|nr:S8 family serine peptidase [Verrucomicrobiota bacterium]
MTRGLLWAAGIAAFLSWPGAETWAQAPGEGDGISEADRGRMVEALQRRAMERKQEAVAMARARGWAIRGRTPAGRVFELMELREGRPLYYITMNVNAAISTAANLIRNAPPYNVTGTNLIVGIWDGGGVRTNHQEFTLPTRVFIRDGASFIDHATHVGGTIGAKGQTASALGMAPSVTIHSYEWTSDTSEMTSRAATAPNQTNSIYLSNHSYGTVTGWDQGDWSGTSGYHWFGYQLSDYEDRGFGQYSTKARDWDTLCYNAPYYLPFKSAGNDRNDAMPSEGTTFYYYASGSWQSKVYTAATDPYADGYDQGGYDTIGYNGVSKNIMTVGAVNDAVSGGSRSLANATMTDFSCWGPADDGSIKPDIVANGAALYSSTAG